MTVYRYKIQIEYDGTGLAGWQIQDGPSTVQQHLQDAIGKFCKNGATVFGAGRTDAGVHALNQVGHFDLAEFIDPYRLQYSVNHFLKPYGIVVKNCEEVNLEFHARFSAKSREYIYKIVNRSEPLAILRNYAWHVREHIDIELIRKAAVLLVGVNDLSSFRSRNCQAKSAIKSITYINSNRTDELVEINISAPSFLHNQVRIIVGCLVNVGIKKTSIEEFAAIINARDRTKAAPTAPAKGLYLSGVQY